MEISVDRDAPPVCDLKTLKSQFKLVGVEVEGERQADLLLCSKNLTLRFDEQAGDTVTTTTPLWSLTRKHNHRNDEVGFGSMRFSCGVGECQAAPEANFQSVLS